MLFRDLSLFSEDLDFTLRDAAHLEDSFLRQALAQLGAWVYEQTGIEVPADGQEFDIYTNPRGNISGQGKLSYRGPVSPRDMRSPGSSEISAKQKTAVFCCF